MVNTISEAKAGFPAFSPLKKSIRDIVNFSYSRLKGIDETKLYYVSYSNFIHSSKCLIQITKKHSPALLCQALSDLTGQNTKGCFVLNDYYHKSVLGCAECILKQSPFQINKTILENKCFEHLAYMVLSVLIEERIIGRDTTEKGGRGV